MLYVDYAQTMLKTFLAVSLEPVKSLSTKQNFLMTMGKYVTAYTGITSSLTLQCSVFGPYEYFSPFLKAYKYYDFMSSIYSWSLFILFLLAL